MVNLAAAVKQRYSRFRVSLRLESGDSPDLPHTPLGTLFRKIGVQIVGMKGSYEPVKSIFLTLYEESVIRFLYVFCLINQATGFPRSWKSHGK